jgi:hypothetical protein
MNSDRLVFSSSTLMSWRSSNFKSSKKYSSGCPLKWHLGLSFGTSLICGILIEAARVQSHGLKRSLLHLSASTLKVIPHFCCLTVCNSMTIGAKALTTYLLALLFIFSEWGVRVCSFDHRRRGNLVGVLYVGIKLWGLVELRSRLLPTTSPKPAFWWPSYWPTCPRYWPLPPKVPDCEIISPLPPVKSIAEECCTHYGCNTRREVPRKVAHFSTRCTWYWLWVPLKACSTLWRFILIRVTLLCKETLPQ